MNSQYNNYNPPENSHFLSKNKEQETVQEIQTKKEKNDKKPENEDNPIIEENPFKNLFEEFRQQNADQTEAVQEKTDNIEDNADYKFANSNSSSDSKSSSESDEENSEQNEQRVERKTERRSTYKYNPNETPANLELALRHQRATSVGHPKIYVDTSKKSHSPNIFQGRNANCNKLLIDKG